MTQFRSILILFSGFIVAQYFTSILINGSVICIGRCNVPCTCTRNYTFQCKDGTCIDIQKWRNSVPDCPDGSDENYECCTGHCKCDTRNGIGKCIDKKLINDNTTQCLDGTDEDANNQKSCQYLKDQAKLEGKLAQLAYYGCRAVVSCAQHGKCIGIDWVLDGKEDCPMADDEDGANFDECELNRHDCDADFATCTNIVNGTYTCKCKPGYTGDGISCKVIPQG